MIPLERINAVLAVAPSDIFEEITSLITKIDQPSPEGKSLLNVYYLEHAKAEEMVRILTETQKAMSSFTESRTTTPTTPTKGARGTPAAIDRCRSRMQGPAGQRSHAASADLSPGRRLSA
jgi:hypothetical protein